MYVYMHTYILSYFLNQMNSPVSHKVNVPVGMDDDAQDISDLFGALLRAHVMFS